VITMLWFPQTFGATAIYEASTADNLRAIVAENYGARGNAEYSAVAVLRASECTGSTTFASLAGKRSCHTGGAFPPSHINDLQALIRNPTFFTHIPPIVASQCRMLVRGARTRQVSLSPHLPSFYLPTRSILTDQVFVPYRVPPHCGLDSTHGHPHSRRHHSRCIC